jgi:hypothetical protein
VAVYDVEMRAPSWNMTEQSLENTWLVQAKAGLQYDSAESRCHWFDRFDHDCQGCRVLASAEFYYSPLQSFPRSSGNSYPMYLQSSRIIHSSKSCPACYMLFEVPRYSFRPVNESHNQTSPSKKTHDVGVVDTKALNIKV